MTRCAGIAALALMLAALASAPTLAQQEQGRPVVGGGSFNEAPPIDPGTFSDSILVGETLLYRVPVAAGQRLSVTVRLDDDDANQAANLAALYPNLYTPLREIPTLLTLGGGGESSLNETGAQAQAALDNPLGGVEQAAADSAQVYAGPGFWYVGFTAEGSSPPTVEIPFTFTVAVEGRPVEPLPDQEPSQEPPPEESAPPASEDARDRGDDSDLPRVIGVLLGGLVLGVISGAVAGFVSRRPGKRV